MGYFKQLHIDCSPGECLPQQEETCYMQPENTAYVKDEEPLEPGEPIDGGDRDPSIDMDRE